MKIKLFELYSHGETLRGIILKPSDAVFPCKAVIVSHGFASNMLITFGYAKQFVDAGYVAVLYDFCMSGSGISSGKSTEMSVVTEKANLVDVLHYVKHLDYVDGNHISLAGCSQGGLVSALTAAEYEQDIESLFLYYPALCIPDDARRGHMISAKFNPDDIPDEFYAIFVKLSRKYADDVKTLDPFKEICTFKKPVLIVHGLEDSLVNINYSRKACSLYPDCTLKEVHGDHGFIKKGFKASKKATLEFIRQKMF